MQQQASHMVAHLQQAQYQQRVTRMHVHHHQQQQQQQLLPWQRCGSRGLPSATTTAAAAAAVAAQQQHRLQFCSRRSSSRNCQSDQWHPSQQHQQHQQQHVATHGRRTTRGRAAAAAAAAAADAFGEPDASSSEQQEQQQQHARAIPPRIHAAADEQTYSLKDTQVLVETAMLSAVSGLAFLLSTLLKLDNSLGYFLPLPITIAACRSGVAAGWHTMMATAFLLLVLLGPLRAITYVLMHGLLAASLGSMWVWQWPWAVSIPAGAVLRMSGQLGYLLLSSLTMNENLFQVMLANVHNLLDQLSAAIGSYGSPSTLAITSMIFALLLVNGICYVFLLHVIYHVILASMGFKLGALPGFVKKFLNAGVPPQQQQQGGR